eukprot:751126-Hanusia_phi.AAC.2
MAAGVVRLAMVCLLLGSGNAFMAGEAMFVMSKLSYELSSQCDSGSPKLNTRSNLVSDLSAIGTRTNKHRACAIKATLSPC